MIPPGRILSGYDHDTGRLVLPEHIRQMRAKDRKIWMADQGIVLARPDDNELVSGGWKGKHLSDETGKRFRMPSWMRGMAPHVIRERFGLLPMAQGGAYSMFEMMQPFMGADAVTISVTNVETIATQDSMLGLPANHFGFPGKVVWFHAAGKQSNVVTTPGTVIFRLRYNGLAGTLLATTGTIAPNIVAVTDNLWAVDVYLKAITTGQTATSLVLLAYGECRFANTLGAAADIRALQMPPAGTSLANSAGLDGRTSFPLTLTAQPTLTTLTVTARDAWIVALN
jgi:hypothetical protein